ncbi:trihelix transcription factor PTL-like [Tasmannia lanceolata]|uniref:trihelix transcription factor PTL-like n=1 Tax=Tasmannia lanceolata TaxID=3420 RepID=UPI00406418F1
MGEQYGLGQLMGGKTHFSGPVGDPATGHRNPTSGQQDYEMMMILGREILPRTLDSSYVSAFEEGCVGDGGTGRWPRYETLTLLEIRSRLDANFKEATQKGPLWDEVSRIMAEEHGYIRSGKKCREKFDNLYKYYKKTKEGKAKRQDGKHYRFFRQLEALYGENNIPSLETNLIGNNPCPHFFNPPIQEVLQSHKLCESPSLCNSSDFDSSSSEDYDAINTKKYNKSLKRRRKSWKSKIREFIDFQMKKFMEIQEAWLAKVLTTLEHKEQERMCREEAWRKQEAARFNQELKFWANKRAWCEARDAALKEALEKIRGPELPARSPEELTAMELHDDGENENEIESKTVESSLNNRRWEECEISSLIKLRSSMELKFEEGGCLKGNLWEEISVKMSCLGYDRSAKRCKDKWENINKYFRKTKECNKKRKENSRTCPYFQHLESLYKQEGGVCTNGEDDQVPKTVRLQPADGQSANDSSLSFLISQGEILWENYGIKLNDGDNR